MRHGNENQACTRRHQEAPLLSHRGGGPCLTRDGKFIDVIGAFNPMLGKTDEARVKLDAAKAAEWLKKGAQPTDRVLRFLDKAGVAKREARNNPQKALPGKKRLGA